MRFLYLLIVFFLLLQPFSYAQESIVDLGNVIPSGEFPDSENVGPLNTDKEVIQGGVESFINISLEDCIKYALGNNPKIQVAMQDVFASNARIKQVWSAYFPQIGWQSSYTRIRQLQLSDVFRENLVFNYFVLGQISLSQMLFDFGVTKNQATIRKLDYEGYQISLTQSINEVVYDVKTAYYNLLYSLEAQNVAKDMVNRYAAFYEQAKAFYAVGLKPKVDVTIAEVNLSNSKLNLIQADNAIEIAMARLNNAMGISYLNKYKVKERLNNADFNISLEEAIDIAKQSRPEYRLADVKVEESVQNIKLVKKSFYPKLILEGQFQIGGRSPSSNYGYNFGSYLNFPAINCMLIKNQIKEAKSLWLKEMAVATGTKNNIYYEVQEAFLSAIEKQKTIPVALLGMKKAKENYDLSYGRYKSGVGNPIELKEAQTEYKNSSLIYYQALYYYNVARATLEKTIGKNLATNFENSKK